MPLFILSLYPVIISLILLFLGVFFKILGVLLLKLIEMNFEEEDTAWGIAFFLEDTGEDLCIWSLKSIPIYLMWAITLLLFFHAKYYDDVFSFLLSTIIMVSIIFLPVAVTKIVGVFYHINEKNWNKMKMTEIVGYILSVLLTVGIGVILPLLA